MTGETAAPDGAATRAGALPMPATIEVCIVGYDSASTIADALAGVAMIQGARVAYVEHSLDPASIAVAQLAAATAGIAVRTAHDPTNPGFGAGVNHLAAGSTADWLVLLNPDATVVGWPWHATDLPAPDEIVGAAQHLPDGSPIEAWGRRYRVRDEAARSWLHRRPRPLDGVGFVGGGAMMIHRATFEGLGGFDERYFLFYEDIDLCVRATDQGCRVRVDDTWAVCHALGSSTRKDWTAALLASYRSGRLFHESHGHPVAAYDLYVIADAVARVVVRTLLRQPERARAHRAVLVAAARHLARPRSTTGAARPRS